MAKVTGIGGVFFKAQDPKKLSAWYMEHLGINIESWGGGIISWEADKKPDNGLTVWNLAKADSTWFAPSESSFMINYRVDNMDEFLQQLQSAGIAIHQGPEQHDNGKFAWLMDPEGNKVELWEPK